MNTSNFARVMIVGTASGCGKTTVTCGILKALINRNIKATAFKCGPDYIDPMFHTEIIGTKSRNLDAFLCGENTVKYLFAKNSERTDISVVEGVMGFYDGLGDDESYSSYTMSKITGTPAVLVVNGEGMSLSIVATIKGYTAFMPNNIKGVIINAVSPNIFPMYKRMIEKNTQLKVLGFLPEIPEARIDSRHLGLVTASEISNLQQKLNLLADNVEKYIDLDGLIELAKTALPLEYEPIKIDESYRCNIAVAKDIAFCFYYQDSLELLEQMGAKLTFFSPLKDKGLPENINGLILGGGYPELYAKELSQNKSMLIDIKKAVNMGIPTYAECGGFMYLQQAITDMKGNTNPMVGVLEGSSTLQNKLSRFGYATLKAKRDNLFCLKGDSINSHEFHFYDSNNNGRDFKSIKPDSEVTGACIFATDTLFAGYPHVHLYGNIAFAKRFVQKCSEFNEPKKNIIS
jgi:cobyrinic acid a,c-diamide synthase